MKTGKVQTAKQAQTAETAETRMADILEKFAACIRNTGRHPYRGKGFFLARIPSKKSGFTWYVRYIDEKGETIPSKWSTGTNERELAVFFALKNRERILSAYYGREKAERRPADIFRVMGNFYAPGSKHLETIRARGRRIGDRTAGVYHRFVKKRCIPWLRRRGIREFGEITPATVFALQNSLRRADRPQTVNYYTSCLKTMFDHLVQEGIITENVFRRSAPLPVNRENRKTTGCYDIDDVKGVFNRRWKDRRAYMLCLLIYTTNMRNGEIERIKMRDVEKINGVDFLRINRSKTENGVRLVPLHPFVYGKLKQCAAGKGPDDCVFFPNGKNNESAIYREARDMMGAVMGKDREYLEKENIKFYSGRKYWKTLMSAEGLGDVEEYFMGHKITADMAKLYNHKDRQGRGMMARKARVVFGILDRRLFIRRAGAPPRPAPRNPPE